jgi:hypothetical protein
MELPIQPMAIPKIATRMKIDVNVLLDEKAYIRVSFYEEDQEFQPIDTKMIIIEGDEYKAWGNDDGYIKNIVFQKLGIQV